MSAWDYFYAEEYDPFEDDPQPVACNRCGARGLYWREVVRPDGKSSRFVLVDEDTDNPHTPPPAAASEFTPV